MLLEVLAGAALLVWTGADVLEAAPTAAEVTGAEADVVSGLDADAAAAVVDEELADDPPAVGSRALKGTLREFDELLPVITKIVSVSGEERGNQRGTSVIRCSDLQLSTLESLAD